MRRRTTMTSLFLGLSLLLSGCTDDVALTPVKSSPERRWTSVLKKIATPSGVRFKRLQKHKPVLEAYLGWASIHGQHTNSWGESKEDKRLAFLINVHNAAVLHSLLRHDLPDRPDDVAVNLYRWPGAGLRWGTRYMVDNEWTSLNHLASHDTINRYMEPLLWIALYDGTRDAPKLQWWKQKGLQRELKRAARKFINSDRGMSKTEAGWAVNPIFIDHAADFTDWTDAQTVCEWLALYANGERKTWLEQQSPGCTLEPRPPQRGLDRAGRQSTKTPRTPTLPAPDQQPSPALPTP